jgi:hypothetical protein
LKDGAIDPLGDSFDPRLTPTAAGLIGTFIGVTSTLLVNIVNWLIGRNRYRREKIWERRQEACSEIVGALRGAEPLASRIYDGFEEDAHAYYGSKELSDASGSYWNLVEKADSAFKKNYLILPAGFRRRYDRLLVARGAYEFEVGPDSYTGPMDENERATSELMDIALSALGIVPFWHRSAIAFRLTWRRIAAAGRRLAIWCRRRVRTRQVGGDEWEF